MSGTSKRRHTIGLIPSSQTLTCMRPAAAATDGAASGSAAGFGGVDGRGTVQPYRARHYAVAGNTHFLMVPYRWAGGLLLRGAGFLAEGCLDAGAKGGRPPVRRYSSASGPCSL